MHIQADLRSLRLLALVLVVGSGGSSQHAMAEPLALAIDIGDVRPAVSGIVTLPDGVTPVAEARVSLSAANEEKDRLNYEAWTDSQGKFELQGQRLPVGAYTLTVRHPDRPIVVAQEQLTVTALNAPPEHVHLKLASGSVSGKVTDRDGKSPTEVSVMVFTLGREREAHAETDDQGQFRMPHVLPGRYTMTAMEIDPETGPTGRQAVGIVEVESAPVAVNLVLVPVDQLPTTRGPVEGATGSVVGRVVDAEGNPVPRTDIKIWTEGFGVLLQTETDETGAFSFKGVPPGRYGVFVATNVQSATSGETKLQTASIVTEVGSGSVTIDLKLMTP